MLQQTQVNTVIPYYERWMKEFPNVQVLAKAPLRRVLKCWEGLGYYSRARNLHQAAQRIVKKWEGKLPDSREKLEELPGIGSYTAGAIASIAFNKLEPILDGNVIRVLSRLFALEEPVDKTHGRNKLWEMAENLVARTKKPGDFNQALMELGALLCLPENPKCALCPVENFCEAHRLKKECEFPVKSARMKIEKLRTIAAVIWKKNRVFLKKQSSNERWGGLWIFPQWVFNNGKDERRFLEARLKEDFGIRVENLKPRAELKHGFTKYQVRLRVYEGKIQFPDGWADLRVHPQPRITGRHRGRSLQYGWVPPQKISDLPLPSPHQKIARLIQRDA